MLFCYRIRNYWLVMRCSWHRCSRYKKTRSIHHRREWVGLGLEVGLGRVEVGLVASHYMRLPQPLHLLDYYNRSATIALKSSYYYES